MKKISNEMYQRIAQKQIYKSLQCLNFLKSRAGLKSFEQTVGFKQYIKLKVKVFI